jgi:hypothetical protein
VRERGRGFPPRSPPLSVRSSSGSCKILKRGKSSQANHSMYKTGFHGAGELKEGEAG